jgi:CO/xanthine dehydrogenase Mo-binding subunit
VAKVQGGFAFSSDMWADNMLWGATLRSPHPYARIIAIDVSGAYAIDGVTTVITAADVPGKLTYGLIVQDQPVFAAIGDTVRYSGEPVAAVAADHPETCQRALAAIKVTYEVPKIASLESLSKYTPTETSFAINESLAATRLSLARFRLKANMKSECKTRHS